MSTLTDTVPHAPRRAPWGWLAPGIVARVLAFMMSVIALSASEMIILRKVLKPQLIAAFAGVVSVGILIVGYLFNAVL